MKINSILVAIGFLGLAMTTMGAPVLEASTPEVPVLPVNKVTRGGRTSSRIRPKPVPMRKSGERSSGGPSPKPRLMMKQDPLKKALFEEMKSRVGSTRMSAERLKILEEISSHPESDYLAEQIIEKRLKKTWRKKNVKREEEVGTVNLPSPDEATTEDAPPIYGKRGTVAVPDFSGLHRREFSKMVSFPGPMEDLKEINKLFKVKREEAVDKLQIPTEEEASQSNAEPPPIYRK